jgi:hypothetical protein
MTAWNEVPLFYIQKLYAEHSARNESTFLMAAIFLKVALGE